MNNKEKLKVLDTKRELLEDAFKAAAFALADKANDVDVVAGLIKQVHPPVYCSLN